MAEVGRLGALEVGMAVLVATVGMAVEQATAGEGGGEGGGGLWRGRRW